MAKHPVIHFEIMTKDPDALSEFFAKTFEWDLGEPMSGGTGVPKYIVARPTGEEMPSGYGINGGIGEAPKGYDGHVTFYIRVDDIEEALRKVEANGGKRMMGPDKVSEGLEIGLFIDPQGHTIGLVNPQM